MMARKSSTIKQAIKNWSMSALSSTVQVLVGLWNLSALHNIELSVSQRLICTGLYRQALGTIQVCTDNRIVCNSGSLEYTFVTRLRHSYLPVCNFNISY